MLPQRCSQTQGEAFAQPDGEPVSPDRHGPVVPPEPLPGGPASLSVQAYPLVSTGLPYGQARVKTCARLNSEPSLYVSTPPPACPRSVSWLATNGTASALGSRPQRSQLWAGRSRLASV